eukprot:RCo037463
MGFGRISAEICEQGTQEILDVFKTSGNEPLRAQVHQRLRALCNAVLDAVLVQNPPPETLAAQVGCLRMELAEREQELSTARAEFEALEQTNLKISTQSDLVFGQLQRRLQAWDNSRRRYITVILQLKQQLWLYQNRANAAADDPFCAMDLAALADLTREDE